MYARYLLASLLVGAAVAAPPVGVIINDCTTPGTVALTFDDGPFIYTESVLNQLAAAGAKATFFVNGQNWGNIYDNAWLVQRMVNEGHQVGSHTWSHADLAGLDAAGITSEMTLLEDALLNIIGKFPTYMRPPYFSYNSATLQTLGNLGYHVIQASIDTLDWQYNTPGQIGQSVQIFQNGLNSGGTISLSHDVHQTTADTLVSGMINAVRSSGKRAVTVGECLGDAAANWYRTSRNGGGGGGTNPPPGGNPGPGPDGSCGGPNGYTCPQNSYRCCSQWGYCGDSAEYCGGGCNPAYGICW